jgi:hypothetical protein
MRMFSSGDTGLNEARETYSIEIKVERRDFIKELKNPQKQRWGLMYSNWFYYCAPKGMIKLNELPPYAGLLEFNEGTISEMVKAPFREAMPPRWAFVGSLLHASLIFPKKYGILYKK